MHVVISVLDCVTCFFFAIVFFVAWHALYMCNLKKTFLLIVIHSAYVFEENLGLVNNPK